MKTGTCGKWALVAIVGATIVAMGVSFLMKEVQDGGMPQVRFQLTFRDKKGVPVADVTLKVVDRAGNVSYWYPIPEFGPESRPTSDTTGRLTFHHVTVAETTVYKKTWFWTYQSESVIEPEFDLLFEYQGREMARRHFNDFLGQRRNILHKPDGFVIIEQSIGQCIGRENPAEPLLVFERFRFPNARLKMVEPFVVLTEDIVIPTDPPADSNDARKP